MAALSKLFRVRVIGIGVATVFAASGCMDHGTDPLLGPQAPSLARMGGQEETLRAPEVSDVGPIARYVVRPRTSDYWIKQWVGPAGGTVDYMGFRIVVPPGAVDRMVMFSIRVPGRQQEGQDYALAEFGPHNYDFRVPVRIELPYRNTEAYGSTSGVLWYNERLRSWVEMPGSGITADGERVYVETNHFSTYGTQQTERGTPIVSGG